STLIFNHWLKYLLNMASVHYNINIDEIDKAIITTNARGARKRATYQPNADIAHTGNYKIESVLANASKTASVSFRRLIKGVAHR
ncbi:hypothetical protein P7M49_26900, partial [Vibrio parahaemolyticus]|nr:hypothetical protein [Vibrio parahaemolyticus]